MCIRGKNGVNNNPDLRTFKSAMKRILLRNPIVASKYGNCVMFEESSTPLFSLKWSKNRTPRSKPESSLCDDEIAFNDYLATSDYHESSLSSYKVAIIAYIGYIIRSLGKSISCATCYDATVTRNKDADVIDYSFISIKDKGGLIYPSHETLKILRTCETVFKCAISGGNFLEPKIIEKTNLNMKLRNSLKKLIF